MNASKSATRPSLHLRSLQIALCLSCIALLLISCNTNEVDSAHKPSSPHIDKLTLHPLKKHLLPDTFALLSLRNAKSALQRYRKSPFAAGASPLSLLGGGEEEGSTFYEDLFALMGLEGSTETTFDNALLFATLRENVLRGFDLHGILQFATVSDAANFLEDAKLLFAKNKLLTMPIDLPGTGSTLVHSKSTSYRLFLAIDGPRLAFSSSQKSFKQLLFGTEENHLQSLLARTSYQETRRKRFSQEDEYLFAFADLEFFLNALTDEQKAEFEVGDIPLRSAALSKSFPASGSRDFASILLAAKTPTQKALLNKLQTVTPELPLQTMPDSSLMFLGLDATLLRTVLELAAADSMEATYFAKDFLGSARAIGMGLATPEAEARYPELLFSASSPDPQLLQSKTEEILSRLLQSTGFDSPWEETSIGDRTIRYVLSPLGIGAFLTSDTKLLQLTSSSTALKASIEALNQKEPPLLTSMPPEIAQSLITKKPHMLLVVDFMGLGAMIQSFQSSLSLVTGEDKVDPKEIEKLRSMGFYVSTAHVENDTVFYSAEYTLP